MYKKILHLGVLVVILVCCAGCKNKNHGMISKDFQFVPVQNYKECEWHYTDFISKIEVIPLNTKGGFMGNVKDLCFSDSIVYILDNTNAVWSFKYPSGELIRQIRRTGHGNGEYLSLSAITSKDSLVYFLDTETRSVLVNDPDFNFINKISFGFIAEDFTKVQDGFLFFYSANTDDLGYFVHTDEFGRIKNSFVPANVEIDTWFGDRVFMENNGTVYMSAPYANDVYKWNGYEPELIFTTDFGHDGYEYSSVKGSEICQSGKAFMTTFFVTDRFLINSFLQEYDPPKEPWKRYYSFYDIKRHSAKSGSVDLSEDIPFCPSWQYDGNLVGICYANELSQWETSGYDAILLVYHLK